MDMSQEQEHVQKALVKMIIIDKLPFSIVEKETFKRFIKATSGFHVLSQEIICTDCAQLFMDEKSKLKSFIKTTNQKVSLSLDTWSSNQLEDYLCITAHFIDDNWDLHKKIIGFTLVSSDEGEEIGKAVEKCLHDWEIHNVMAISTANVSSNDVAVSYLKKRLMNSVLDGRFLHVKCGIDFTIKHMTRFVREFYEWSKKRKLDGEDDVDNTTEFDRYINEGCEKSKLGDSYDILLWWKTNSARFPILSKIAKDVLAIPMSAIAPESAFSTNGNLLDDFRSSLSPEMVESLICTQDWLRESKKQIEVEEDLLNLDKFLEDDFDEQEEDSTSSGSE